MSMFKNLQNCLFGAKEQIPSSMHRTNHRLMSNIQKEELLERAAGKHIEPLISGSNGSENTRTRNGLVGFVNQTEEPKGFSNLHKLKEYATNRN